MLSSLNVLQSSFRGKTALSNSTLLQKVSFAGKEYSLEPIDEKTPILFQWFEARPERYEKGEVPILNTKEHPYLSNIINAAKIENERIIGVLVDGNFTYEQKKEFLSLENE
ncbi:type III secretion system effector arginine glycosyltransferase NleB, partial [Escherichia coli]